MVVATIPVSNDTQGKPKITKCPQDLSTCHWCSEQLTPDNNHCARSSQLPTTFLLSPPHSAYTTTPRRLPCYREVVTSFNPPDPACAATTSHISASAPTPASSHSSIRPQHDMFRSSRREAACRAGLRRHFLRTVHDLPAAAARFTPPGLVTTG